MSTPERPGDGPIPGELRPMQGHPPVPTSAVDLPTRAPTPGLSPGAATKVPGSPTLPEGDPAGLSLLIAQLATQLYRAPPSGGDDVVSSAQAASPGPNGGPALSGAPVSGAAPQVASAALGSAAPATPVSLGAAPSFPGGFAGPGELSRGSAAPGGAQNVSGLSRGFAAPSGAQDFGSASGNAPSGAQELGGAAPSGAQDLGGARGSAPSGARDFGGARSDAPSGAQSVSGLSPGFAAPSGAQDFGGARGTAPSGAPESGLSSSFAAPSGAKELGGARGTTPSSTQDVSGLSRGFAAPAGAKVLGPPSGVAPSASGFSPSLSPAAVGNVPIAPSVGPAPHAAPAAVPSAPDVSTASPFSKAPSFEALFASPAPVAFTVPLVEAPAFAPFEVEPVSHGFKDSGRALFDPHALRREFPILQERVNGRPLVWLDNAATTQKPRAVIDRLTRFYERENSNIHRAAHTLAARATDAYEAARESVRRFLNAGSAKEILFVRGATEGINLVAQSWGRRYVGEGDEVLISTLEHHANIVPWQMLCAEKGARLRVAPVDDSGQILLGEYEKLLNPRTRLVAFTAVSNALGTITPARQMVELAHRHGARVLVDGAQAVSHQRVDVQQLDCDFYVFSGHKVFAPTGIGVVFGKAEVLEHTPPWQGGGNMIQDVTFERTVYHPPPGRFEAGTGNIADAVGLGTALDWLSRVGIESVSAYEHGLLEYATEHLREVPGLKLYGTAPDKAGVMSFTLAGQKTEEVGGLLDKEGIAVRSGHHCAQPILRRLGVEATVRASLAPYNTREDIDALLAALHRLQAGR